MTTSVGGSEPVTRDAQADEDLLDTSGAGRHEHSCALRADDVGVRDVPRGEEKAPRGDIDPVIADEERDVALEDVERLLLVVMKVQRRPTATRVVDLDLREGVTDLGAAATPSTGAPRFVSPT
jgi:hypothetical protein